MLRSQPNGSRPSAGNEKTVSPPRSNGQVSQPHPNEKLSRRQRLIKAADFREAYAQNRSFPGRYMVMWLRSGPGAALRLGVVSGRGVGCAVERNRARRRLREVFRRHRRLLSGDVDVILVARRAITRAKWSELTGDFMELAARAGLLGGK